jgi:hypothetical protein
VASIAIASNALLGTRNVIVTNPNGQQSAPVAFQVLGVPIISVSPTEVHFPPTAWGSSNTQLPITIANIGTATLSISDISVGRPFTLSLPIPIPPNFTSIPAGGQSTFDVAFSPLGSGPFTSTLTVVSDALNAPSVSIPVDGTVVPYLSVLFTNDVHGLWNKQMEDGRTVLQRIADETTAEKQSNPEGTLLLDAGDVVFLGNSVTDYSGYLLAMRAAGYDAVLYFVGCIAGTIIGAELFSPGGWTRFVYLPMDI